MPLYKSGSSATQTTTASNAGAGSGVYASVTGSNLYFKSLVAGTNVTITSSATEITIGGPAGSGEANTASNLGAGTGFYSTKVGVDLQFKSLVAGSNVTISSTATEVTIASTSAAASIPAVLSLTSIYFNSTNTVAAPSAGQSAIFSDGSAASHALNTGEFLHINTGWRGRLTTSTISTSISFASTGLVSATLPVGYYQWNVLGSFQSNTTTCGFGACMATGNATIAELQGRWSFRQAADGTDSYYEYAQTAAGAGTASASVIAAATKYPFMGFGWFYLSAKGTVALHFRSEVASPSQVTLSTGASLLITFMGG